MSGREGEKEGLSSQWTIHSLTYSLMSVNVPEMVRVSMSMCSLGRGTLEAASTNVAVTVTLRRSKNKVTGTG